MKRKHLFVMALALTAMLLSGCGQGNDPEPTPEPTPEPILYTVDVEIECVENLLFSKYDVTVLMDDVELGTRDHGTTGTFTAQVEAGEHTLSVQKEGESSVDGSVSFSVEEDMTLQYKVSCSSSQVSIEENAEPEETTEPPAEETPSPEDEQTPAPEPVADTPETEAIFSQETAKRAAVVAMTNG